MNPGWGIAALLLVMGFADIAAIMAWAIRWEGKHGTGVDTIESAIKDGVVIGVALGLMLAGLLAFLFFGIDLWMGRIS